MNILYLHGMASSHESDTARYLQEALPQHRVIVPDLSIDPSLSFPLIDRLIVDEHIDVLVGHSLGGFMAQKYRNMKKVLINPSLGMNYMYLFKGKNKYKHIRYDGNQQYVVTAEICKLYKQMEQNEFVGITDTEDNNTIGLFGKHDLYTRLSAHRFKQHYSQRVIIPGRHFLKRPVVIDYVAPLVDKLLSI